MDSCDGCKWWSELCAMAISGAPLEALCLNSDATSYSQMAHEGCALKKLGNAIDDPANVSDW